MGQNARTRRFSASVAQIGPGRRGNLRPLSAMFTTILIMPNGPQRVASLRIPAGNDLHAAEAGTAIAGPGIARKLPVAGEFQAIDYRP